jgi:uncharacterized protein YjdB
MRLSHRFHTTRAAVVRRAWIPPFLGAAVLSFALACGGAGEATGTGGGTGGSGGDKLAASVTVSPSSASLTVGGTEQLTATARDADGGVLTGRTVSWSSSSPAVASVVGGKVTGSSGGAATITATVDGRSSSAALTVKAAVAKVTMPTAPATFLVNQGISFAAVVTDASGNVLTGRTVTYSSSNTAVATVLDGLVTAVAPGTATITATCEGVSGSVTVTITAATSTAPVATVTLSPGNLAMPVGTTEQVLAILKDAAGQSISGRAITWSSSQPSVATVANGIVTGVSVGSSIITATSEGKSGTMLVTVVASSGSAAVATVTVSPDPTTVDVGYTTQLTATLKDANGQLLTGRTVTWTSSDPAAASVNASGVVTGISFNANSAGNVTITATAEGKSGTSRVGVLAPDPVASITLNPGTILTLAVNETATYTATLRNAGGGILTGRIVTWTSSNTNVATVSATGVVTAKATGTSNISASSGGKSASVQVVVQQTISRVDNVRMTPDSMLMQVAAPMSPTSTRSVYAEPRDASYNLVSRPITWTSSNPSVASVAGGVVSALSPGLATISATADGVSGTTKVRVFAYDACARFDMYPATTREASSIPTGVWAIVRNADSVLVQNKTVTWTSSNPAVVSIQQATTTVDPSGKYTSSFIPMSAGSATITASCDGMSGTIPVTVTAGQTVATITLTPNPLTIVQGMTGKPTLVLKDAGGAQVYRTPAWSTGNSAIATVAVDGTVTGVSAGTTTLTASIDGKTATITVSVTNESTAVASVVITPANPSIMVGNDVQFTATMKNAQGTVLSGKTVTWGSSNYLVGYQMNTTGLVNGRSAGTSVISATSEGVTGTTVLTVGAPAASVAYVGVTPTPSTIAVNGTVQLSAQLRDGSGNILTGRTITWSSANTAIATVSGAGLVTGKSAGTTSITATADGVSGSATVTVTGTGGGGGGGGSVCSSLTLVAAPTPGNSTSWLPTKFTGMDYMISTGTVNYGTQAAPKWGYTVTFRNRYTQQISFGARGPSDTAPTTTLYAKTLGAGLTGATNTEYWSPPATLWVYIDNLKLGTSTTNYCE